MTEVSLSRLSLRLVVTELSRITAPADIGHSRKDQSFLDAHGRHRQGECKLLSCEAGSGMKGKAVL